MCVMAPLSALKGQSEINLPMERAFHWSAIMPEGDSGSYSDSSSDSSSSSSMLVANINPEAKTAGAHINILEKCANEVRI